MLHLDPLISHSDLPWSAAPRDNVHKDKPKQPQPLNPSPTDSLSSENPTEPPQAHQPDDGQTAGLLNDASRQSTPLSELSSPSERAKSLEPSDASGIPDKAGTDSNHSAAKGSGWRTEEGRGKPGVQTDGQSVVPGSVSEGQSPTKDSVVEERQSMQKPPILPLDPPAAGFNPSQPSQSTSPQPFSRPPSASYRGQSADPIPRKQSTGAESVSSTSFPIIQSTSAATSPTNPSEQKLDTKVVTILELNAELLRVGMELQTRGVSMSDPRFAEFSKRMQSNLTWMAAVADSDRGGLSVSLPIMHPPPSVDFVSMERIYQLYSTLPTIFANDISRRQNGMGRRSQSPSVSLKRDRTDEHATDTGNKRRDTGEHKLSSLPTSPSHQPPTSFTTPNTASTPRPVTPSVSMGPPSHVPPNADPRRQMTAMRPPMQPQQNLQPIVQSNNIQPNPQIVQPNNPPANMPANIPPQIVAMGAAAMQYYQILQNPSHPMIQYIVNAFPGFQSLPINQQIVKMHQVQSALAKNKAQAAQRPQSSAGGQGNFPAGNQFRTPTSGVPPQTQGVQQPGISFPQTFNNGIANTAAQNMIPPQQTTLPTVPNLNAMTANQRQLLMMHQMRAGGSGNATNPPLLNAQTVPSPERIRTDQPRMSPGSPTSQLPMGVGMDMNSFQMTRSNSTVPGIARSARSPTDPTGLQGRATSNSQEEMQRAFAAQQQRNMMMNQGNPGFVNPQQMLAGGNAGNWQQQVGGGMGVMGQQPQQPHQSPTQPQNFGMLPAQQQGNFGSPMVSQQQWNTAGGSMQYSFPTSPSPGGTAPQQQQISPHSSMMDPSVVGDFDFSSWTNQM